jgi:uncharacterized protein (TIGR02996 family)
VDDRAALFANVLNRPADETARLVLADWLEEHGEDELGRFLRAGVVAARFNTSDLLDDPDYYAAHQVIADVTAAGSPALWLSELGLGPNVPASGNWAWDNTVDRVTVRVGSSTGVFTRGLLSELTVPLLVWNECASRALARWPVELATITDMPGLSFWIDPPDPDRPTWRLSAAVTVQARRGPRGLLRRLRTVFSTGEIDRRPIPPNRWAAERDFPDREALVRLAGDVWSVLFDEVRVAAGTQWTITLRSQ